jgi:DNA-binding response OmpR family regulator
MEGRQVLVIEQDWRLRKLIRANLESLGFKVREAINGRHGLDLLQETQPCLLVLDLDLLEMDALHLLGACHAQSASRLPPVIVMSTEPPNRRLLRSGLVASHLQKPFAASVLVHQVRQALDGARTG